MKDILQRLHALLVTLDLAGPKVSDACLLNLTKDLEASSQAITLKWLSFLSPHDRISQCFVLQREQIVMVLAHVARGLEAEELAITRQIEEAAGNTERENDQLAAKQKALILIREELRNTLAPMLDELKKAIARRLQDEERHNKREGKTS
jgi:hypothetical protein